jgi:hypothetical protein
LGSGLANRGLEKSWQRIMAKVVSHHEGLIL